MIKEVKLTRFKKYNNHRFQLLPCGVTLFVGGNNSGKSTLIQALAVWEFCKMVLLHEKGRDIFNESMVGKGEGYGMSAEDFLPIAMPSLNHLWTNLKTQLSSKEKESWPDKFTGYILRILCKWDSKKSCAEKYLEIGLALANDRLFIRVTKSNLNDGDDIPNVVYLPTFAGVIPKENKATHAERRAFLGKGMAGSILRNMVYDLYLKELEIKKELLQGGNRLRDSVKKEFLQRSPLQRLQKNLRETFRSELEVMPFSEDFHTTIKINERKGVFKNGEWEVLRKTDYSPRDIITQGSGYLQWLSIFSVLYAEDVDVLLLDEPDAHLHASLQKELFSKLSEAIQQENGKQILVSTHSVEMIEQAPLDMIFSMDDKKYLNQESSRVSVLSGIGSEYCPKLDCIKKEKRLVFFENESDLKIIKTLGEKCGSLLKNNFATWANTHSHADRRRIYECLKREIPSLKCISLRDRDMDCPKNIRKDLTFQGISGDNSDSNILFLEWRRKNIESYLLCPKAIANASGKTINEVKKYFNDECALSIEDNGYTVSSPPETIITVDGKNLFTKKGGIQKKFGCDKYAVAQHMGAECVCEDIKIFIKRANDFFGNL